MTSTPTEAVYVTDDDVHDGESVALGDQGQGQDSLGGGQEAPAATLSKEDRSKALRKAYGEATTALREKHKDEFEDLYEQRAKANGVTDYERRLSPEQKAERDLAALLEAHPHLRDKVQG
jgi:hypothetical protein